MTFIETVLCASLNAKLPPCIISLNPDTLPLYCCYPHSTDVNTELREVTHDDSKHSFSTSYVSGTILSILHVLTPCNPYNNSMREVPSLPFCRSGDQGSEVKWFALVFPASQGVKSGLEPRSLGPKQALKKNEAVCLKVLRLCWTRGINPQTFLCVGLGLCA